MDFETFSKLEQRYIFWYNYWTDKLDRPDITLSAYRRCEQRVLVYDQKLAQLHARVERFGLTG